MKMKVGAVEIDVSKLIPIRAGDLRKLQKLELLDNLEKGDFEASFQLALTVLRRGVPELTEEQLDTVSVSDLRAMGDYLRKTQNEIDRPTSAEPTASSAPMGGASPS